LLVTDAGAWVRALLDEESGDSLRTRLRGEPYVDAPALIDLEFLSAVRGLLAQRRITTPAADASIERFLNAPINRYSHVPLARRVWQLRASLTPYDGAYVALAEKLGSVLLTVDRRLARAPMIRCEVELLA
jgi:predicted nucleic acid-binding protein